MERNQARIAARPTKPVPLDAEAKKAKVDAFRETLYQSALAMILGGLESHKREHGLTKIDEVAIGASVAAFVNFINGNGKFVAGKDTDALIALGIEAVAKAGAEAKRRTEDRRVLLA
ncbi:hypothetical protein EP7_004272 [Isosphaeraceae bacterium EP7]